MLKIGAKLAKQGVGAHFPVVFIPGIVSTGLEVWQGTPCAQKHFRYIYISLFILFLFYS